MGEGIGDTDRELDALREKMRQLESLDDVIAEGVRRTRVLLEEASELRDRARNELADARAEIDRDRAELVAIAERILGGKPSVEPTVPGDSVRSDISPTPVEAPASLAPGANSTIIVNGVTRPAIATALRAHLMGQAGITAVDPREFAEGVLRLQVVASVPITESLFSGWKDGDGLTLVEHSPNILEIVLPGA